jgi:hypothetical protein
MISSVEIVTLQVNRKGDKIHFQIQIPQNGKDLVGIGVSGVIAKGDLRRSPINQIIEKIQRGIGNFEIFKQRYLLGELRIHSYDNPKFCFYTDVFFEDNGFLTEDYSTAEKWSKPYTHSHLDIFHPLDVKNESTILNCMFLERLSETNKISLQFEIKIYLYYKCRESKK